MEQLRTLESTTRAEELRASEEARRAALLEKEKELALEKLSRTSSDLDAAYTRLAAVNDELSAQRETAEGLDHTVQSLTAWRSAKDNQVAALVREKTRLFRLVADLRSTIRGAGGALAKATAAEEAAEEAAAAVAAAVVSPSGASGAAATSSAAAHKRSASKSRPSTATKTARDVNALIAGTLSGTLDRPAWSGRRSATARSSSGAAVPPLSTPEQLDRLSFEGQLASLALRSGGSASAAHSARSGTSAPGSARSTAGSNKSKAPAAGAEPSHSHSRGDSTASGRALLREMDSSSSSSSESEDGPPSQRSRSSSSRAHSHSHSRSHSQSQSQSGGGSAQAAAAKQNLVLRLKKHIELLEEKNKELEKVRGCPAHFAAVGARWREEWTGAASRRAESDAHTGSLFFLCVCGLFSSLSSQSLLMVRNENQLLLVRFRGAHDRRTQCEKKLKQCEAELALLRGVRGAQSYHPQSHSHSQPQSQSQSHTQAQVHPVQHYAPHAHVPPQQQQQQHGQQQHGQQQQHQALPAMLRSSPPPPSPYAHHAAHTHFPSHQHHQQHEQQHEHDAGTYEEDAFQTEQQQHDQQGQQEEQYAHGHGHDGPDDSAFELQPLSVDVDVQPFELSYDSQRPYSPTAVRTQQQRHGSASPSGAQAAPERWK